MMFMHPDSQFSYKQGSKVAFSWSCPAPTDLWAPLINHSNIPHLPLAPLSPSLPTGREHMEFRVIGQAEGGALKRAPHASQDQALSQLESEEHLQTV